MNFLADYGVPCAFANHLLLQLVSLYGLKLKFETAAKAAALLNKRVLVNVVGYRVLVHLVKIY
jgi:hypothetical protein